MIEQTQTMTTLLLFLAAQNWVMSTANNVDMTEPGGAGGRLPRQDRSYIRDFTSWDITRMYMGRNMNALLRFDESSIERICERMEIPSIITFCEHRKMAGRMAFVILLRRMAGNPRYVDLDQEFNLQPNLLSGANVAMIR